MKAIIPDFNLNAARPIYLQLYDYIKSDILTGSMTYGERLPSLRQLSESLGISITTVSQSYNQLAVEGYIEPRPHSGYYIKDIGKIPSADTDRTIYAYETPVHMPGNHIYDLSCFDFNKWKKCSNRIFTEFSHLLMFEGDPQGEEPLRYEISRYVFNSRGVVCSPDQIVIGAGTQQITIQLTRILNELGISHAAMEEPGYMPVRNIFKDNGFVITPVPVRSDGICIERLPDNIRSVAYVSPSNQFPTGAVMPIGRRRELLEWAYRNNSIIIEDDYDSELRYFGRPVPAMQGIDEGRCVVYLGSFSSTLFPSIKISYMVLPDKMADIFQQIKSNYTQTCSKAEQLTLALFMENGMYQTNIKKLRNLYSHKLQKTLTAISDCGGDSVRAVNTSSGINVILETDSAAAAQKLCARADEMGLDVQRSGENTIIFYYSRIPLERTESLIWEWLN